MISIILAIVLEVVKALGKFVVNYYSPEEIKQRREAKLSLENKDQKKELKDAIVDYHLNDLAASINERILASLRQPNQDPKRWRSGFSSQGLEVPSEDPRGDGKEPKSGSEGP